MQGPIRHLERPADGEAVGGLVFFHGYYGIPDDFLGFVDKLDPEHRLHAFLPAAPFEIGEGRASWFDPAGTRSLAELDGVASWLDALRFDSTQLVVAGWSQGAAVAYALGLGRGRPRPAAVVALGGSLLPEVELDESSTPRTPVAIGHGRADEAVPVADARSARDRLRGAGNEPLYLETGVGHEIDQEIVPALRSFVGEVF